MRKVKIYALALVLVLGCLGVAYAIWKDELVIAGTVETGDMNVKFMEAVLCFEGDFKDIVIGSVLISSEDPYDAGYKKTVTVEIDEFYPCVDGVLYLKVQNQGSVPVILEKITYKLTGFDGATGLKIANCDDPPEVPCKPVWWGNYPFLKEGTQLGQEHSIAQKAITFKLEQTECDGKTYTMNQKYEFTFDFEFVQYNKSTHYPH